MKSWIMMLSLTAAAAMGNPAEDFIASAREKHGDFGERAARYLVAHMPERDRRELSAAFLSGHLDQAMQARREFPWAAKVPEELFFNDVLPYAVFDETREPWRAGLLEIARPLVAEARTANEAAQTLNRDFFKRIGVHYHQGRKAPNQSPSESMATGRASCTGLSILLVNACRAVGIPARAAGTPMWTNGRGNHTWVEIWDAGWHFTGADEHDAQGLNRGWFIEDASRARADEPLHAIYATSWKTSGLSFPMPWAPGDASVAAVNVTTRYAKPESDDGMARLGVRLFSTKGGERISAQVLVASNLTSKPATAMTKSGTADLNDMPRIELPSGTSGTLLFLSDGEIRQASFGPLKSGESTLDLIWPELMPCSTEITALASWLAKPAHERPADHPALSTALTREEAMIARGLLGNDRLARIAAERAAEMENRSITHDGMTMRWLEKSFGKIPPGGRSLWITLHGGGNAPAEINDQQWQNQVRLYQPAEGILVAPRAPTNTWNLWHEGHIDPMLTRLIENFTALRGVNPDKVYLTGYSAGGDGVWQLAPRMADRFAAAAMMAGHPNEASLEGLRNLPFAIFMGADDGAFDRNKVASQRTAELARLREADPSGYTHLSRIYPGLGHWMNGQDAEALPWMARFQRQPWPSKVVWLQDDITHDRFYWLKIPDRHAVKSGQRIVGSVNGQTIRLTGDVPAGTTLRLSDELLDLDREITLLINDRELPPTKALRTAGVILQSLAERADPSTAATAWMVVP
jgi:hypothetical protein